MSDNVRKAIAEFFGTFTLVFCGTGAIVVNESFSNAVTHPGIALTFGLIVMAMIYAIGDVSGCHLNPAVTVGFWADGRFSPRLIVPFLVCQCGGAILASLTLHLLFPDNINLGATRPAGTPLQSFVFEFLLTLFLMFVILNVSTGPKETGVLAGVAIGGVVALEAMFAGPVCGASMNPARSLGPALVSQRMDVLWLYLAAPVLGALAAVVVFRAIRPNAPSL
ncbi:MAG: aquaporin [Planctomyces sp.]|nr:aquaporin [Planctomyces sp.]